MGFLHPPDKSSSPEHLEPSRHFFCSCLGTGQTPGILVKTGLVCLQLFWFPPFWSLLSLSSVLPQLSLPSSPSAAAASGNPVHLSPLCLAHLQIVTSGSHESPRKDVVCMGNWGRSRERQELFSRGSWTEVWWDIERWVQVTKGVSLGTQGASDIIAPLPNT